jgi:aerobic carbon-monoxide dehydrogenase large subunit
MTPVVGTSMKRKEDPKLLTGEGKFVDDLHAPGELWMGMVRSTMAHATINGVDTSAAGTMPGSVPSTPAPS